MAISIKQRGKKYTFTFYYKDENGINRQQYEAYSNLDKADERAKMIEFLKWKNDDKTLLQLVNEYNANKAGTKTKHYSKNDNMCKTFSEFIWAWAQRHAHKVRMKPSSYAGLKRNIRNHIEPYFGKMIVSKITPETIEDFFFQLSQKKCRGAKSYKKSEDQIPTLKGSSLMKVFNIIRPAFRDAETWGYTKRNPISSDQAPAYKYAKRKFWKKEQVQHALEKINDPVLHLAVHLAFMCNMRPGEVVGTDAEGIDLANKYFQISQALQRVETEALEELAQDDIIRIFPKKKPDAKTVMILKKPKTEKSERKGFLNMKLCEEIEKRLQQIEQDKRYYGKDYHDYGLLFCFPNGDPIEPRTMDKRFKKWQKSDGVSAEDVIDMQGLRKSATMYKLRLTNYDVQVVGGEGGQTSATTILDHYDEVLEEDRRKLSIQVENDFYGRLKQKRVTEDFDLRRLFKELVEQPDLAKKLYACLPVLQKAT